MDRSRQLADKRLADLLREAGAAARTGDLNEAERLYRRVLEEVPEQVQAWLGLGAVLVEPTRKAACFRRVLELDPGNADAAASLARLQAVLPAEGGELTCAFHPKVKTVLRCSQCGRPICARCAVPYPVGQLCPTCVRGRRPAHYQVTPIPLIAAGAATLGASALAGLLVGLVVGWGGLLFSLLGGPMVGGLLSRVVLWAGQRRRGLPVQITAGVAAVVGSLLGGASILGAGTVGIGFLLYVGLMVGSLVTWLR